jgi:hypothetical protein
MLLWRHRAVTTEYLMPTPRKRFRGVVRNGRTLEFIGQKRRHNVPVMSRCQPIFLPGGPGLLPGAILNFGQQNQVTVGGPGLALFETWVGTRLGRPGNR